MSKECLVCKTPNYSAANHCSNCGSELPDKELLEEDKLRIELYEAKTTIQGLNKALAEIQNCNTAYEEAQKTIADYEVKLTKAEQEKNKYKKSSGEYEILILGLSRKLYDAKNTQVILIVLLLIFAIILGGCLIELNII